LKASCTTSPDVKARSAKRDGGTSGALARRWYHQNTPNNAAAAASEIHVQADQPCSRPSMSGSSTATSAAVTTAAPGRSSRARPDPGTFGTRRGIAASTTAPTGTLIRKIARQPSPATSALISAPPTSWPNTAPSPAASP
jgi:hypothetical protein